MRVRFARSTGVEQAVAAPVSEAPSAADVAFEALYRESRDDVFSYVAGLLRDRHSAEDVTALAFERAYRRRRRYDERKGSMRAWLFGIARNAAIDELRRRGRVAELATDPEDEAAGPDEDAETALRRAALRHAMRDLTPRERELIALKFFAGLTNPEIAAVIGVSESNAGTRVHRVVTKLREACDEAA
jgi:RNA polymerase sigma-70 factor (ECF subfamily)